MADYGGYKYRCGYCGTKGDEGRCPRCGSGMDHEDRIIANAHKSDVLIKRWLASRDRGWNLVDEMRTELSLRRMEDMKEGRDPNRFDGIPDPMEGE